MKLSIQNRRGAIVHWLYVLSSEVIERGSGAGRESLVEPGTAQSTGMGWWIRQNGSIPDAERR